MYHNLDPVFAPNYYAMAQIFHARGQHNKAIETFLSLINAKECRVDLRFLQKEFVRKTLLDYQTYIYRQGQWMHLHEDPKTYSDLGGAYWMNGDAAHALQSFQQALALNPNFTPAKQNLEHLSAILRSHGSIQRVSSPPAVMPQSPANAPSFELIPSHP
jgi:tetratricopeptide (TPR) repeat protein